MAKRPIFLPLGDGGLVEERLIEFEWFPGFAAVQKQKSIQALHAAAGEEGVTEILEISTKSLEQVGTRLSAFNLWIEIEDHPHPVLLEAAYQGSKVFRSIGRSTHLYTYQSGKEIKRYMKDLPPEPLEGFEVSGHKWELEPKTAFYDWLYVNALHQLAANDDRINDELAEYEAFTDIEFNPDKSINCQARSCALYVALDAKELLRDALSSPKDFLAVLAECQYGVESEQGRLPF